MRLPLPLGAALLLGLLAGGCGASDPASGDRKAPLTKIILQTDWYAQAEHGGYYQAMLKGYYRDAGLDVTIQQSGPMVPIGQKLATGMVQFMIGRGDDAICQIARDIPFTIVAAHMEHDLQALLLHADSPVRSFADLEGRPVMTAPGSAWVSFMEQTYHVHIPIIPLDFGMARFMADPNFIQQCFLTNEPYYVGLHGSPARVLLFSDGGYDFYRVLAGNADWVRKHPRETRAFVQASIRGWDDYLNGDPTLANQEIMRENPQMEPDFIAYAIAAMKKYRLVTGDPAKGEANGLITRKRIQEQINILQSVGVLDRLVTPDEVANFTFTQPN
jgi:NitT/TauT family transport system substrate-binding protein